MSKITIKFSSQRAGELVLSQEACRAILEHAKQITGFMTLEESTAKSLDRAKERQSGLEQVARNLMEISLPVTDSSGFPMPGKTWTLYREPAYELARAIRQSPWKFLKGAQDVVSETADIWLKADLGIAWEGGIDAAMEAAVREITKLRKEAAENLEMAQAALRSSRTHKDQRDALQKESDDSKAVARILERQRDEALKFKSFVHQRLDEMGVNKNPGGPHTAKGCRIGDRLDIVAGWKAEVVLLRGELQKANELAQMTHEATARVKSLEVRISAAYATNTAYLSRCQDAERRLKEAETVLFGAGFIQVIGMPVPEENGWKPGSTLPEQERVEGLDEAFSAVMDGTCTQAQAHTLVVQLRADAKTMERSRIREKELGTNTQKMAMEVSTTRSLFRQANKTIGYAWDGSLHSAMEAMIREVVELRAKDKGMTAQLFADEHNKNKALETANQSLIKQLVDAQLTAQEAVKSSKAATAMVEELITEKKKLRDELFAIKDDLSRSPENIQALSAQVAEGSVAIAAIKRMHAFLGFPCMEDGKPFIDQRIVDKAIALISTLREEVSAGKQASVAIKNLYEFLGTPDLTSMGGGDTVPQFIVNHAIFRIKTLIGEAQGAEKEAASLKEDHEAEYALRRKHSMKLQRMKGDLKLIVETLNPGALAHGLQKIIDGDPLTDGFQVGQTWAAVLRFDNTPVEVLILAITKGGTIIGLANGCRVQNSVYFWDKDGKSTRGDNDCGDLTKLIKGA